MKHIIKTITICAWVVFTTFNRKEFEDKLNSLPSYTPWNRETKIMTAGNSSGVSYTIVYWDKDKK